MNTPIYDFVQHYAASSTTRFHMPGHKGQAFLGCEPWDLTEIKGADALYEADGIIAESEANATALFGSEKTLYSTEGSSQCIRAMLYLAVIHHREKARTTIQNSGTSCASARPTIVAARNVHKAFVYAAALLDLDVVWLWPEETDSLCDCPISAEQLEQTLSDLTTPPAAVYLTSPDYLGGMADIPTMAEICHRHNTLLLIDNAHGAYLRFLQPSQHPLDLGADMCCDSAHKTLPVLTGGAYLHIAKNSGNSKGENDQTISGTSTASALAAHAKSALALFGSTSPSYLTLASLDHCNRLLAGEYPARMAEMISLLDDLKAALTEMGWDVVPSDPLRLTLRASSKTANAIGNNGMTLAQYLREHEIECEYADDDHLVLMLTPENTTEELDHFYAVMNWISTMTDVLEETIHNESTNATSPIENTHTQTKALPQTRGKQILSIREAVFAPHEVISVEESLGRICGTPTVSCPPAIPIAVSGEEITQEAIQLFRHYGITEVDVVI